MAHGLEDEVEHQVGCRNKRTLRVGAVMRQIGRPVLHAEHDTAQPQRSSRKQARRGGNEPPLNAGNLHAVLRDGAHLHVVPIGLGGTTKEMNGVGVRHVPFERFEDVSLGLEDLELGVGAVGAAEEVVCAR